MKRINITGRMPYWDGRIVRAFGIIMLAVLSVTGCASDEEITRGGGEDGALLEMRVAFEGNTRLAELEIPGNIMDERHGLKDIGLYIYYSSDYASGNLSEPYIRNMRCKVDGNRLVPAGADEEELIYIYDNMKIVAFYPYNPDAPDFTVKDDEHKYPITRNEYSEQHYIPYRADTYVNPASAFYVQLSFIPEHTSKIEVFLVNDENDFPEQDEVRLVPHIDPVDGGDPLVSGDGRREKWCDDSRFFDNDGTGSYVKSYVAYVWETPENGKDHGISVNDVVFESDGLTLLAAQDVDLKRQKVYRYGYNMKTGEIIVPTSSFIVNDVSSLSSMMTVPSGSMPPGDINETRYQICDIDFDGAPWTPKSLINVVYDGGGHNISNMVINSDEDWIGMFSQVKGWSAVKNTNLVSPKINVTADKGECFVGAICGQVNDKFSDEDLKYMFASLPKDLSDVVCQILVEELMAASRESTSQIMGCSVTDPEINIEAPKETKVRVGTVAGVNGFADDDGEYRANIWDTYSTGGKITVNAGVPGNNADVLAGGFCGENNYFIGRCYSTIDENGFNVVGLRKKEGPGPVEMEEYDMWTGFTTLGEAFEDGGRNDACYANAGEEGDGVYLFENSWPAWGLYSGNWPVNTKNWTAYSSSTYWRNLGVAGTGEYPYLVGQSK